MYGGCESPCNATNSEAKFDRQGLSVQRAFEVTTSHLISGLAFQSMALFLSSSKLIPYLLQGTFCFLLVSAGHTTQLLLYQWNQICMSLSVLSVLLLLGMFPLDVKLVPAQCAPEMSSVQLSVAASA